MTVKHILKSGVAIGGTIGLAIGLAAPQAVQAAVHSKTPVVRSGTPSRSMLQAPSEKVMLGTGRGTMIRMSRPVADVFIAEPLTADVQVRSPNVIYLFGKKAGETSFYATDSTGAVVYSANVRVGDDYDQVRAMLRQAMPDAQIDVMVMSGVVILTGTVASASDSEEAERLVAAMMNGKNPDRSTGTAAAGARGEDVQPTIINRLKTAMPMQVNLQVRIAEVNRDLLKEVGVNLLNRDQTGGFSFGVSRGSVGTIGKTDLSGFPTLDASSYYGLPTGSLSLPFNPATGQFIVGGTTTSFNAAAGVRTAIGLAGKLFGMDVAAALDLLETDGAATMLAQPSLTAVSGETASFLAGGEIPIPLTTGFGNVSVEYKQYGVGLAFTPTVLSDGRISLRVRPEVSELNDASAVRVGNLVIPGLTTRRAETTVELGSGQSFMIGGLLRNNTANTTNKAPFLGDLPILGALFRSNSWRKQESELVIVVTPYLVKPVSGNQIRLPTDGYRAPTDAERVIGGQSFMGVSGAAGIPARAKLAEPTAAASSAPPSRGAAAPGFSINDR